MFSVIAAAGLVLGVPTPACQGAPIAQEQVADPCAALKGEFDEAFRSWKKKKRSAKGIRERRALGKENPVLEYMPRFERLADEGHGEALLWILEHLKETGGSASERRARRLALYERLIAEHVPGPLHADIRDRLFKDKKLRLHLGMPKLEALATRLLDALEDPVEQAAVRFGIGHLLIGLPEEADVQRGAKMLDELLKEFPTAPWAEKAKDALFEFRRLRVGCVAPDFTGATIDGEPVRLSDYRGRVVVLDFFGFW